ncbi:helix-turn-helix transcriptional regulator [Nocardioides hwasunensis]|uniref:WYL domain-containing protein n=1 Tax=Nocardioides hwasunensis TaxID=397258 RepID=A0ABR8MK10_9ACTN|nr:WYL domain-containing protein [Nocardioides hwasunensis]MBD3914434.1 WYL domain-containing protein [Nocardioides hwasunensis]
MATSDPTVRTLELLVLLQARATWPATELAERLGTSARTLRRDLHRLGSLGYEVVGKPGPGGHYQLVAGSRMPPLVLDDDEVVALVTGLRMVEGDLGSDAGSRALVKLQRVLPRRLADRVAQVAGASEVVALGEPTTPAGRDLSVLTRASVDGALVRFDYNDQHDVRTHRTVDSIRCLYARGRWSVLAFDHDRADWRLFSLERMDSVATGGPAERRYPPAPDLAEWLRTDFGRARDRS